MAKGYLVWARCNKEHQSHRIFPCCDNCFEPFEVEITSYGKFSKKVLFHDEIVNCNILNRYSSFYTLPRTNHQLSLKEGFTPLIQENTMSSILGLDILYLKNETINQAPPSGNKMLRKLRLYDGMVTIISDHKVL